MGTAPRENVAVTGPEIADAAGDDVFIKGKKIGAEDYRRLAAFFEEENTDPALWNAVLLQVAKSEDTKLRRMVLAITLNEPVFQETLRKDRETYLRGQLLVHESKPPTTTGWKTQRMWLSFWLFMNSTQLLIILVVVAVAVSILLNIYYDLKYPGEGHFFRGFSMFRMFHR